MNDMKLIDVDDDDDGRISYRDQKYFVKTWDQMETVKNDIGS